MKKRLTALLCVMTLLLSLFPQTAFAAGSLEGVDYSRIGSTGYRATLTLDELEFEGQLSRGSILSQSEQDKIIRQTMNDLHITSGMLLNAKSMLDAAQGLEGFSLKDVTDAALKLTGAQDVIDLYHVVMGDNATPAQIAEAIAADQIGGKIGDTLENQLEDALTHGGKAALKGAGKYAFKLLFLLPDLTEIGLDSLDKYETIKETIAVAMERQLLLETFYDECNKRIQEASGDRGKWEIRFDGRSTRTYNCTFWGVSGVMMQAALSGVLEQVSEIDGHAGQYRGTIWLDLESVDMAGFDAGIPNTYPFDITYKAASVGGIVDYSSQTTILKRQVQGKISVMVTGGSGTQVSEVSGSLTSGGDETEFSFNHKWTGYVDFPYVGRELIGWWHYTSSDPAYLQEDTHQGADQPRPFPGGIGTVWKPLESKPVITVYLGN